jgi:hypothetical protein
MHRPFRGTVFVRSPVCLSSTWSGCLQGVVHWPPLVRGVVPWRLVRWHSHRIQGCVFCVWLRLCLTNLSADASPLDHLGSECGHHVQYDDGDRRSRHFRPGIPLLHVGLCVCRWYRLFEKTFMFGNTLQGVWHQEATTERDVSWVILHQTFCEPGSSAVSCCACS